MSAFKGTPGPWKAQGDMVSAHHAAGDPRVEYWICEEVNGDRRAGAIEGRPSDNARLIAAAPDLLGQHEADMVDLDLLAKAIHAGDPMPELVIRVTDMLNRKRAAIAKALGEQP